MKWEKFTEIHSLRYHGRDELSLPRELMKDCRCKGNKQGAVGRRREI